MAPSRPCEGFRVLKSGYLVKSPPLDGTSRLLPKRWMLRWFVLYDCRDTDFTEDLNGSLGYGMKLLYFKDHRSYNADEDPLGTIQSA